MTAFQHDVLGNTFQHACLSVPAKGTQCRLPARLGAVGVDSRLRAVMELVIEKTRRLRRRTSRVREAVTWSPRGCPSTEGKDKVVGTCWVKDHSSQNG